VVVPEERVFGGGAGWVYHGKQKKRKRPLEELFKELEQSIREQVFGSDRPLEDAPPAVVARVVEDVREKVDELEELAAESEALRDRLVLLKQELDEYRFATLLDDDDDWFMMQG
jgi:hypothetical protein